MVASINTNNLALANYNSNLTQKKSVTDKQETNNISNNTQVSQSHYVYPEANSQFYCNCVCDQISTLNDYITYRNKYTANTKDLTESDYKAEFNDYMKSRGCNNEQELAIVSSTDYLSKDQLVSTVKEMFSSLSSELSLICPGSRELDNEQLNDIMSNLSLQDMANFMNHYDKTTSDGDNSLKGMMTEFKNCIDKASQNSTTSQSLKNTINAISNKITSSASMITQYSNDIDAANEKARKEKGFDMAKNTESILFNYQNSLSN